MRKRRVWDNFTLATDEPKCHDGRHHKMTRGTPKVLVEALACDDHKRRWALLREYAARHQKRFGLWSWLWLQDALMSWDTVG